MADDNGGGAGPALVSMAQAFTGLPMEALIGGPLMAAAKANHQMACDQVNYLLSTCFNSSGSKSANGEGGGNDTSYSPIMITMTVKRPVLNGTTQSIETVETQLQVPLLTIMPMNTLAVDNVEIKFHMEVKSSFSEDTDKKTSTKDEDSGSFSGTGWIGPFSCTISGSVSHDSSSSSDDATHYAKSNLASYDVTVHAGQIAAPPGVGVLIQAFANAITPIQMPTSSAGKSTETQPSA